MIKVRIKRNRCLGF